MHNITEAVAQAVVQSGIHSGLVTVFTPSATSAITTTEPELGMVADFQAFFERMASQAWEYKHNEYLWAWRAILSEQTGATQT